MRRGEQDTLTSCLNAVGSGTRSPVSSLRSLITDFHGSLL